MDFKKIIITFLLIVVSLPVWAKTSYQSILKKWTRTDKVYVWDNFEARMIWNATYLSHDFREARRKKLNDLLEWTDEELLKQVRQDSEEASKYDVFFVSIYAGSSKWPEIGKDDGQWRIFLEPFSGHSVLASQMERVPVKQIDRELFPYLDKWSQAYYVRFPKKLGEGQKPFSLRMAGLPAKSQLVWE